MSRTMHSTDEGIVHQYASNKERNNLTFANNFNKNKVYKNDIKEIPIIIYKNDFSKIFIKNLRDQI